MAKAWGKQIHGLVVVLVDRHTASTAEIIASFVRETRSPGLAGLRRMHIRTFLGVTTASSLLNLKVIWELIRLFSSAPSIPTTNAELTTSEAARVAG